MSDVFIAYARNDKPRVGRLAAALEKRGWTVWWDPEIPPGKSFDSVIEEALDGALCVIVVWSGDSVHSDWVKTEAAEGKRRHVLVPVLMDDVKIPLEFRRIQSANLADWEGGEDPEFIRLLSAVAAVVGDDPEARPRVPSDGRSQDAPREQGSSVASTAPEASLVDAEAKTGVVRISSRSLVLRLALLVVVTLAVVLSVHAMRTRRTSELPSAAIIAPELAILGSYKVDIYYDEGSEGDSAVARTVSNLLRRQSLVRQVVLVPKPLSFTAAIGEPGGFEIRYHGSEEEAAARALAEYLNGSVPSAVFRARPTLTETAGTLSVVLFSG